MAHKTLVVWLTLALLCVGRLACAATWTVAVVGMESDPRYQARRLEHNYPGHPAGRALDAARLAVQESDMEIEAAGHKLQVKPFLAADLADLPKVLAQVRAAKAQYLLFHQHHGYETYRAGQRAQRAGSDDTFQYRLQCRQPARCWLHGECAAYLSEPGHAE